LGVPIRLEKEAEAVVAPIVAACDGDIDRRPARHDIDRRPARRKAALGLVVQHRDKLGAIVGLAVQRLVRDDDRGSRHCGRRDAIKHILRDGMRSRASLASSPLSIVTAVQRRPASLRVTAVNTCVPIGLSGTSTRSISSRQRVVYRRAAGCPPSVRFKTKPQIALEQIRAALKASVAPGVVLMDASYGTNSPLRQAITELGLCYVAAIISTVKVRQMCEDTPKPRRVSVATLARSLPKHAWRTISRSQTP